MVETGSLRDPIPPPPWVPSTIVPVPEPGPLLTIPPWLWFPQISAQTHVHYLSRFYLYFFFSCFYIGYSLCRGRREQNGNWIFALPFVISCHYTIHSTGVGLLLITLLIQRESVHLYFFWQISSHSACSGFPPSGNHSGRYKSPYGNSLWLLALYWSLAGFFKNWAL